MIIGEIIFPNNIPNLNQILFKGVKKLELINPKIKKIKEMDKEKLQSQEDQADLRAEVALAGQKGRKQ